MGKGAVDAYSLLHFAVGIVAYFWNVPLVNFIVIHILFEIVENTQTGMNLINTLKNPFTGDVIWPGGKDYPDAYINSIFDVIFGVLGWLFASIIFNWKMEK